MDRRSFINRVAGALLAAPLGAEAQPAEKVYRVGYLGMFPESPEPRLGCLGAGSPRGRLRRRTESEHRATVRRGKGRTTTVARR